MKFSCLKGKNDEKSFNILKKMGADIYEIEDFDKTDDTIKQLVQAEYTTIFITNELAGFSEDIIKKYNKNTDINIIIAPRN
jgi:vacuolar-type H+-ATPase subunit F/Vma7